MDRNRILTELPLWSECGKAKEGSINWKDTVGMELDLLYYGEIYKVKVIKYNYPKLWFNYDGYVFDKGLHISNINKGNFGRILKLKTKEFKCEIGESFKDDKRDLIITERGYKKNNNSQYEKWYKYTCNKCAWIEGWMIESSLIRGNGCACCAGKVVVPHINSIWAKAPWMMDLGVSEEDAKRYTVSSGKKIEVTCPDCGKKKKAIISKIYNRKSIQCICGDGKSYPEKFMNNLLNQIGIEFEIEYNPEWIKPKRYDFYLNKYNCIIESHGVQHYEEVGFKRSKKEEQYNDELKKKFALKNGIKHYITIDCRESNLEYIKNSILNSKLNELFDLSKVDWLKCDEFALKNIVKEACEYWKNKEEWENTKDLSNIFKLSITTIIKYLKKGTKLEWCDYNSRNELAKISCKNSKMSSKKVEIFKDEILLGVFPSYSELERQSEELFDIRLDKEKISDVCRGIRNNYKGFTFRSTT